MATRDWTRAERAEAIECARRVGGEVRARHGLPAIPEGYPDPEGLYVAGELREDGSRGEWLRGSDGRSVLR
jgi:hypothetical protein